MVGARQGNPPPDPGRGEGTDERGGGENFGNRRAAPQINENGGGENFGSRRAAPHANEDGGGEIAGLKSRLGRKEADFNSALEAKASSERGNEEYRRELESVQKESEASSKEKDQLAKDFATLSKQHNDLKDNFAPVESNYTELKTDIGQMKTSLLPRTTERGEYKSKITKAMKNSEELMLANSTLTRDLKARQKYFEKECRAHKWTIFDKKRLEDDLAEAKANARRFEKLFHEEQGGELSTDQKIFHLQSSLSESNTARDQIQGQYDQLSQDHKKLIAKYEKDMEDAECNVEYLQRCLDKQKALTTQAEKGNEQLREGMEKLVIRINEL